MDDGDDDQMETGYSTLCRSPGNKTRFARFSRNLVPFNLLGRNIRTFVLYRPQMVGAVVVLLLLLVGSWV